MWIKFCCKQKKKSTNPKRRFSEVQSERRNPSRKARPPEHFGLEKEEKAESQKKEGSKIDIQRLIEARNRRSFLHDPKKIK